ncbi:hypothetical protein C8N37_105184 [Sphingobacterium faecium]|nr:hypothetical protein C8N37_105184 [Sphingobacterium faecium]
MYLTTLSLFESMVRSIQPNKIISKSQRKYHFKSADLVRNLTPTESSKHIRHK